MCCALVGAGVLVGDEFQSDSPAPKTAPGIIPRQQRVLLVCCYCVAICVANGIITRQLRVSTHTLNIHRQLRVSVGPMHIYIYVYVQLNHYQDTKLKHYHDNPVRGSHAHIYMSVGPMYIYTCIYIGNNSCSWVPKRSR